jgi:predicted DNA-binding ribbon-helix-helix protein
MVLTRLLCTPWRCIMVQQGRVDLPMRKRKGSKVRSGAQPRTSVTFPPALYETLEDLAKKKKVSLAWVVREAAERYVADQWPLFGNRLVREADR